MTTGSSLWVRILLHCRDGFTPIKSLIGEGTTSSSLHRAKDRLLEKGWLETEGKDRYRTTPQGLLKLQTLSGEVPKGLSPIYPPLTQVPTQQHRAVIELTIAAVIARRNDLRPDRHPTIIMAGRTLTWKTSTGIFLCHMLGLDPSKHIVNLAAESGRSLWLRKTSTGAIAYKRELLDTSLVVFDEYQDADPECKRLLGIWMDGRKNIALENQQLTIEAVPLITLNPSQGKTLEERLGVSKAQIRRSITCDLTGTKMPDLAMKGEDIVNAAKAQGPLKLSKPHDDCSDYKVKIHELFRLTLNQEGQELADIETLKMLSSAMTSYLEPVEAIRLVFYDSLLLFETLGWTQAGWAMHVRAFPNMTKDNVIKDITTSDRKTIPDQAWIAAFEHLKTGGTASELVTKLHLTVEDADRIAKKYVELKNLDAKTRAHDTGTETEDEDVRKLEREVRMAELRQKKAEHERPLETDKELTDLNATLDAIGIWKQGHCSHMKNNYCMYWQWKQRPAVPYQTGEPLPKRGKWYILPTHARCAVCFAYHELGTPTLQTLEINIKEIWKVLQGTPTLNLRENFQCLNCGSKGLVAARVRCTKCGSETWWGYHPQKQ